MDSEHDKLSDVVHSFRSRIFCIESRRQTLIDDAGNIRNNRDGCCFHTNPIRPDWDMEYLNACHNCNYQLHYYVHNIPCFIDLRGSTRICTGNRAQTAPCSNWRLNTVRGPGIAVGFRADHHIDPTLPVFRVITHGHSII